MKRRTFLASAAALAALPATPAPAAATVETVEIATLQSLKLSVARPSRPPWWGWSDDDYLFQGPFDSREAAIEDARENGYGDDGFTVALCRWHDLYHPDYVEGVVDWLEGRAIDDHDDDSLGWWLRNCFHESNLDHDFDGEGSEACAHEDWEALAAAMMPAIEAAIARTGLFISLAKGAVEPEAAVLEELVADVGLHDQLRAIADAWSADSSLLDASCAIDTSERESIAAEAASA